MSDALSQPTTAGFVSTMTPDERDRYLLRRLRDLENLVVQLGAEIAELRRTTRPVNHYAELRDL